MALAYVDMSTVIEAQVKYINVLINIELNNDTSTFVV